MKNQLKQENKPRKIAQLLGMVFLFLSSCSSDGLIEKTGQWDRIQYGDYLVENTTWNVQAARGEWTETIFYDTLKGSMGWEWDFPGETDAPGAYVIKSFPEIIFGRKPYAGYLSTTTLLPSELTSVRLSIGYEYYAKATGIYNTSTDISFTDSKDPKEENIRAKMMIWFDHQDMPFFESEALKQATIDGREFKVFIDTTHTGPEGKWAFIALLPDRFPSKGEINLNEFIDFFLSEGTLKPEWYLSSIEVGSEIASGEGKVTFKRFVVH